MRHLIVLLAVLLLPSAHAQKTRLRLSGRIARGEVFRKDIPGGLEFLLLPTASDPGAVEGWTIQVSPKGAHPRERDDFVWVVTPPYRGYNARDLDTSYGTPAKEAVGYSPREFHFVLDCAGHQQEAERVSRVLWPYGQTDQEVNEAREKLGSSPQGKGILRIRDARIGPAPKAAGKENLGRIERLDFEVKITMPKRP
jgi:hypothetical protein